MNPRSEACPVAIPSVNHSCSARDEEDGKKPVTERDMQTYVIAHRILLEVARDLSVHRHDDGHRKDGDGVFSTILHSQGLANFPSQVFPSGVF